MIQVIRSSERHYADHGWLQTHWHFSFSDYYDPDNMGWGPLRVFNDDVVQPGKGFDMHPHRDMEIVTYVIDGELEHRDHLGNRGVVRPGEVQVMSAGKGIKHSEYNPSQTEPVHLLQLWVTPRSKGGQPRWDQRRFTAGQRGGRLLPVVSSSSSSSPPPPGGTPADTLAIDQDATIYVSRLEAGAQVVHESRPGRRAYLFVISGAVAVNGTGDVKLSAGDQARIADEPALRITADSDAELMLLDLP